MQGSMQDVHQTLKRCEPATGFALKKKKKRNAMTNRISESSVPSLTKRYVKEKKILAYKKSSVVQ